MKEREGLREIKTIEAHLLPEILYKITIFKRTWENCLPMWEANAISIKGDLHPALRIIWESAKTEEEILPEMTKTLKERLKSHNIKISYQINIFEDANT